MVRNRTAPTGVLQEDLEEIAADSLIPWGELQGRTILITGGTGTLGSALARGLSVAGERHGLDLRVIVHGRERTKATDLLENYGVEFVGGDIREPLTVAGGVDYLFHAAALAKSPDMVSNPVGVAETAFKGTYNAFLLATEKKAAGVVFLSSLEVYGETDPARPWIAEEDLGRIDLQNPRSCYPEGKRMGECLASCFHAQYGLGVKTARLAQTFGAGSSREDTLVVIQFARSAMAGEDLVLHTAGKSRGNFCYISDAVRGLILLLLRGKDGEAYNITNSEASVTIREMAELVAKQVCAGRVSVQVREPEDLQKRGYQRDVTRRLSSAKLEGLGWRPRYGLADMYERTIRYWRESEW